MLAAHKGVTKKRLHPMETEKMRRRCATGGRCCRWSSATSPSSAPATRWTSPTRWRWPRGWPGGSPTSARSSGPVRGGAARRVPGHLRGPAGAAAFAVRAGRRWRPSASPRSVTRTSRSTAGAERARRPWRFPQAFGGARRGPGAAAADQLAQRRGDPRRRQPTPRRCGGASRRCELGPAPGAGRVEAARLETAAEEAALVADWLAERWRRRAGAETSAAVLCRKRSQFAPVIDALEARGVPYEVVGLGGLLLTPEVEDLVSLLCVVHDPDPGRPADAAAHRPAVPARGGRPRRAGGLGPGAAAGTCACRVGAGPAARLEGARRGLRGPGSPDRSGARRSGCCGRRRERGPRPGARERRPRQHRRGGRRPAAAGGAVRTTSASPTRG